MKYFSLTNSQILAALLIALGLAANWLLMAYVVLPQDKGGFGLWLFLSTLLAFVGLVVEVLLSVVLIEMWQVLSERLSG